MSGRGMFAQIALFEFRYQLRGSAFWSASGALALTAFGLIVSDAFRLGTGAAVHKNGPLGLAQIVTLFSILYLFVLSGFTANAVIRDDETRFGPILWSAPVGQRPYLLGRFAGVFAVAALGFLAVPAGVWIGAGMASVDTLSTGPNRVGHYVSALALLGLPNLLLGASLLFACATLTRSMAATYLAVIALLAAYAVATLSLPTGPDFATLRAMLDPFGIEAVKATTRYWLPIDQNTRSLTFEGLLRANRLLWLSIAGAALASAVAGYRRRLPTGGGRRAVPTSTRAVPAMPGPLPRPTPARAAAAQLRATLGLELVTVIKGPMLYVLLAVTLLQCAAATWNISVTYGTSAYPLTLQMIQLLFIGYGTIPVVIAIFYAGEAVWRERERRISDLIDSTPVPGWVPLLAKTAVVVLVLTAILITSVLAAMAVQAAKGFPEFQFDQYLFWYLIPRTVDLALIAVLAVTVQVISPHKFVGWGVMLLYVGWTFAAPALGIEHNLWRYGAVPTIPLSDLNGSAEFAVAAWWYRMFWVAVAVLLLIAAHLLWPRGRAPGLPARVRAAIGRLRGRTAILAAGIAAFAAASGSWIVYNTTVLNPSRGAAVDERDAADLERRYLRYERLAQPTITAATLTVALFPEAKRVASRGRYVLTNQSGRPVADLHLLMADRGTRVRSLHVPGATLQVEDLRHGYRIYRLARPLSPGGTMTISFATERRSRGFRDAGADTAVVANGSFLTSLAVAPFVGMNRSPLLQDWEARRRQGLPAVLGLARLDDPTMPMRPRGGLGWARTDITVSTSADQLPLAPGRKVADAVRDGRRIARFVSDEPSLPLLSIQSARYAVARLQHRDVALEVYHHSGHRWNVARMLAAMRASLDYYRASFGPYPFKYGRIVEFPDYESTARAFAGTIAYSEGVGFIADNRDPASLDYVAFVTAHEIAHQYWGHQLIGGDGEGEALLSEALAEYSALMVIKHRFGTATLQRYLAFERDRYLAGRAGAGTAELPLIRVGNQPYLHYAKGALALYRVQERIGETAMNRALATFLARHRFAGPPYPRATDLVAELKRAASDPADRALIDELFERVGPPTALTGPAIASR